MIIQAKASLVDLSRTHQLSISPHMNAMEILTVVLKTFDSNKAALVALQTRYDHLLETQSNQKAELNKYIKLSAKQLQDISQTEQELDKLTVSHETLSNHYHSLSGRHESLLQKHENLIAAASELTTLRDNLLLQLQKLSEQHEGLQKEFAKSNSLQSEVHLKREHALSEIQLQHDSLALKFELITQDHGNLQALFLDTQNELNFTISKVQEVTAENLKLVAERDRMEFEHFHLSEQHKALTNEHSQVVAHNEEMQSTLSFAVETMQVYSETKAALYQSQTKLQETQTQLVNLQTEHASCVQEFKGLQDKYIILQSSYDENAQCTSALEQEVTTLCQSLEQLENDSSKFKRGELIEVKDADPKISEVCLLESKMAFLKSVRETQILRELDVAMRHRVEIANELHELRLENKLLVDNLAEKAEAESKLFLTVQSLSKEKSKLLKTIADLQIKFDCKTNQYEALLVSTDLLTQQFEKQAADHASVLSANLTSQDEFAALMKRCTEAETAHTEVIELLKELSEEHEELHAKHLKISTQFNEIFAENTALHSSSRLAADNHTLQLLANAAQLDSVRRELETAIKEKNSVSKLYDDLLPLHESLLLQCHNQNLDLTQHMAQIRITSNGSNERLKLYDDLVSQYAGVMKETNVLKSQHEELLLKHEQISALGLEQAQKYDSKLADVTNKLSNLEAHHAELLLVHDSKLDEIVSMKSDIKKYEKLRNTYDELKLAYDVLKGRNDRTMAQLEIFTKDSLPFKFKELSVSYDALLLQYESLTTEHNNILPEVRKLKDFHQDQDKIQSQLQQLRLSVSDLSTQNAALDTELTARSNEHRSTQEEFRVLIAEHEHITNLYSTLSTDHEQMSLQFEKTKVELGSLTATFEELALRHTTLTQDFDRQSELAERMLFEHEEVQKDATLLGAKLRDSSSSVEELTEKLGAAESRLIGLQSEVDNARLENLSVLARLEKAKQDNLNLDTALQTLLSKHSVIVELLEKDPTHANQNAIMTNLEFLRAKLNEKTPSSQETELLLQRVASERNTLEAQLQEQCNNNQILEEKFIALTGKHTAILSSVESMRKERDAARFDLENFHSSDDAKDSELTVSLVHEKIRATVASQRVELASKQAASVEEKFHVLSTRHAAVCEELASIRGERDLARSELRDLLSESAPSTLAGQLADIRTKLMDARLAFESQRTEVSTLRAQKDREIFALKQEAADNINVLQAQRDVLKAEVEMLKIRLQDFHEETGKRVKSARDGLENHIMELQNHLQTVEKEREAVSGHHIAAMSQLRTAQMERDDALEALRIMKGSTIDFKDIESRIELENKLLELKVSKATVDLKLQELSQQHAILASNLSTSMQERDVARMELSSLVEVLSDPAGVQENALQAQLVYCQKIETQLEELTTYKFLKEADAAFGPIKAELLGLLEDLRWKYLESSKELLELKRKSAQEAMQLPNNTVTPSNDSLATSNTPEVQFRVSHKLDFYSRVGRVASGDRTKGQNGSVHCSHFSTTYRRHKYFRICSQRT